jgi:hypothetical protein
MNVRALIEAESAREFLLRRRPPVARNKQTVIRLWANGYTLDVDQDGKALSKQRTSERVHPHVRAFDVKIDGKWLPWKKFFRTLERKNAPEQVTFGDRLSNVTILVSAAKRLPLPDSYWSNFSVDSYWSTFSMDD